MSRELLQQALDALENPLGIDEQNRSVADVAINAIRQALAAPQPAPAVREPLKDWEFVAIWATAASKYSDTHATAIAFGRAIERAHGITGDSNG